MESKEKAKKELCRIVDKHSNEIIEIGENILRMPEKGFQEFKTSSYVQEVFKKANIPFKSGLAITGVRADLICGKKGPVIAVIGELDALAVPSHPFADKQTGAAHACGHNSQISGIIGAAIAISESGVLPYLGGKIAFMAVPAEEFNDMNYRLSLRKQGKISFLSGKQEFIKIGCFDDINISMMIHASSTTGIAESYNGFVFKVSRFEGRASHAAASPHIGINALQSAHIALAALNAQNETYLDEEHARVHSIFEISSPAVNVIASEVLMETQIRASTVNSILEAAKKADRAIMAGALALGAKVSIETIPGYMPMVQNKVLVDIYKNNLTSFIKSEDFHYIPYQASSTDMGDVSQIMPAIHPYLAGWKGVSHGNDFKVVDKYMAYVLPAKVLAMCLVDLLWDNASSAKKIIRETQVPLTKEKYLKIQEKNFNTVVYDYSQ